MAEKKTTRPSKQKPVRQQLTAVHKLLQASDTFQDNPHALLKQDGERICAWSQPVLQQTYVNRQAKKRRSGAFSYSSDRSKAAINLNFNSGIWNNSVEKHSYRYVPNNGCYRQFKELQLNNNAGKANRSTRKIVAKTHPTLLSSEQRKLQRELTRDLQKEFQSLNHLGNKEAYFKINDSVIYDRITDRDEDYNDGSTALNDGNRPAESKSALPFSTATESTESSDISIKNRANTSMESAKGELRYRCMPGDLRYRCPIQEPGTIPGQTELTVKTSKRINRKILNVDKILKETVSQKGKLDSVGEKNVAALAKQTFNTEGSMGSALRPIEKLTPSMREAYENSKATQHVMKIKNINNNNTSVTLRAEINTKSILPLQSDQMKSWLSSTDSVNGHVPASIKSLHKHSSSYPQYKVSKLDAQPRSTPAETPDLPLGGVVPMDSANNFLPCISGKGIRSKLSTFR